MECTLIADSTKNSFSFRPVVTSTTDICYSRCIGIIKDSFGWFPGELCPFSASNATSSSYNNALLWSNNACFLYLSIHAAQCVASNDNRLSEPLADDVRLFAHSSGPSFAYYHNGNRFTFLSLLSSYRLPCVLCLNSRKG